MAMEEITPLQTESKRPPMLTVLCILSFIWSGLMTLFSLILIFAVPAISTRLANTELGALAQFGATVLIIIFLLYFILWGLSLWGAILMFSLRKSGFIMYIIPNGIFLIFQMMVMFGMLAGGVMNPMTLFQLLYLLVSILFIVLYATQLKHMR